MLKDNSKPHVPWEVYPIEVGEFPIFRTWTYSGSTFTKGTPVYQGEQPPFKKRKLNKTLSKDNLENSTNMYIRKEE